MEMEGEGGMGVLVKRWAHGCIRAREVGGRCVFSGHACLGNKSQITNIFTACRIKYIPAGSFFVNPI